MTIKQTNNIFFALFLGKITRITYFFFIFNISLEKRKKAGNYYLIANLLEYWILWIYLKMF
jgi:hypothetical protein